MNMSGVLSLKTSYYEALKRLTLELAGIHLGDDHAFLVETRLGVLARQEGYQNLNQMVDDLFGQGQTRLAIKVVSSLLERDTHFNPDPEGLQIFKSYILPNLHHTSQGRPVNILSFACSSGQEPYSIAIMVDQYRQSHPDFKANILGVDYPSPALARAEEGKYTHFEVQRGLPIRDLITYFDRAGEDWVAKPALKSMVSFKEFHLLSKLDGLGEFDLVLFRNSLEHYSSPAQIRVVRSLSSIVKPERFLMFGSNEIIPSSSYNFERVNGHKNLLKKHPKPIIQEAAPELPKPPPMEYTPGSAADKPVQG